MCVWGGGVSRLFPLSFPRIDDAVLLAHASYNIAVEEKTLLSVH